MKETKVSIIYLLAILLLQSIVYADLSPEREYAASYDINTSSISPRASALGGAYEAIADDSLTAYYNPAGLSQLYSMNVDLGGGILSADRMLFNVGYSHPFKNIGVFSVGIRYFRSADMEEADENGNLLGKSFSSQDVDIMLAYGRKLYMLLYGLSAGIRCEYLYNKLFDENFNGYALSYGLLYRFYKIPVLKNLSTGLTIENIPAKIKWSTGTKDDVTSRFKFGLAYRLFHEHLIISGHFSTPRIA